MYQKTDVSACWYRMGLIPAIMKAHWIIERNMPDDWSGFPGRETVFAKLSLTFHTAVQALTGLMEK
jgi:hypothetical protein